MSDRYKVTVAGGLVIQQPVGDVVKASLAALASAQKGERAYIRHGDSPGWVLAVNWLGGTYHLSLTLHGTMVQWDNPTAFMPGWVGLIDSALKRVTTTGEIEPTCQTS